VDAAATGLGAPSPYLTLSPSRQRGEVKQGDETGVVVGTGAPSAPRRRRTHFSATLGPLPSVSGDLPAAPDK
jgi:hypothetical protein